MNKSYLIVIGSSFSLWVLSVALLLSAYRLHCPKDVRPIPQMIAQHKPRDRNLRTRAEAERE